ncbi:hypothetical protein [Halobellus inordinatus]|uniref:hypothetical protein n=1 Tax=Halobellus inordinatus TaxID=1126236 RepID=UPI002114F048|nr:hypothetical protein [Halobellus ramosii]
MTNSDLDDLPEELTKRISDEISRMYGSRKYPDSLNLPKPGGTSPLWRYIDFTQYVSILEKEALHFSRPLEFSDSFEGSLPKKNIENRKNQVSNLEAESIIREVVQDNLSTSEDEVEEMVELFLDALNERLGGKLGIYNQVSEEINKRYARHIVINCWHQKPNETAAMWNVYTDTGIVMKSNLNKVVESIDGLAPYEMPPENPDAIRSPIIGKVKYIDYDREEMPDTFVHPFFYKRKSFKTDQEVRIAHFDLDKEFDESGEYRPVSVSDLIEEVRLAPGSKEWYKDLVKSITREFDFDFPVVDSNLEGEPQY